MWVGAKPSSVETWRASSDELSGMSGLAAAASIGVISDRPALGVFLRECVVRVQSAEKCVEECVEKCVRT